MVGPTRADAGGRGRDPSDVVATVSPDLVEVTVEKVAINAVSAGVPAGRLAAAAFETTLTAATT
ncbi:hypothetical protein [Pseudonocardia endophytica]|uniref:hypothetical protein n=1 Tax=Pseudonocardia endophytica TaxID=401976 RepID=UPI00104849F7|nr:hypothetical protein [Pseudonocardia endophytica]